MFLSRNQDLSVLVLNNHCHVQGGASRVAIDEAVGLAHHGMRVTFLGATGPVCDELSIAPLRVVSLDQPEVANAGRRPHVVFQSMWNQRAYAAVAGLLKDMNPARTIVHLHGFSQALSASPVRAALDSGFEVVCTLHDFFSACPNGGFFDFVRAEPCHRRALSVDCVKTNCDRRRYSHKLYRVMRTAVQRRFTGLPTGVRHYISLSQRSKQVLKPYLPRNSMVYSVGNPVEVPANRRVDVASNKEIVAIGRLDLEKGIEILIDAVRRAGMRLTLIGDGPLRGAAEASGVCRVTGWVSRDVIQAELELARVLVFPSLWYETYGLAVDEAAGRGIPAIVSDVCAAAERVEQGVSGWLFRSGDVLDLVRCLGIVRDDTVVGNAGRSAYDRFWQSPPTRKRHIEELTEVYETILRQPKLC